MKLGGPTVSFFTLACVDFCFGSKSSEKQFAQEKKSIVKFHQQPRISALFDIATRVLLTQLNSIPTLIAHNLSGNAEVVENIIQDYAVAINKEDVKLDIIQLIKKYGFSVELHTVQTDDGYILTLFRIPGNGRVVFLMHGLLGSADDWVTPGPKRGIAYLLASKGHDVWMGNARGNKHSKKHKTLFPTDPEFWNFSWEEIGEYDLPAMIDCILSITDKKKLYYVGHSQGTTSFFVMGSLKPEYNKKISLMVALSAVAWMSHIRSPLARLFSPAHPFLRNVLHAVGDHEFSPSDSVTKMFQLVMCGKGSLAQVFCNNLAFLLCGFNVAQLDALNLPILYGHIPSGASTKQIIHYGQEIVSGRFQKFNYGFNKNMNKYGSRIPPDYPVEKVTAPVAIFTSDNDWFSNITDVEFLRKKLPHVVEVYNVPDKQFNNLDYIFANDVDVLVFSKLHELLNRSIMIDFN